MDKTTVVPSLAFTACCVQSSQVAGEQPQDEQAFTVDVADVLGLGASSVVCSVRRNGQNDAKPSLAAKFLTHREGHFGCQASTDLPQEAQMLAEVTDCPYVLKYFGLYEVDLDEQPKMRGFFTKANKRNSKGRADSPEMPPRSRGLFLLEEICFCTLHDLVECSPFKESEAAFTLHSALKGLEHLHALGIVHRDLKTANIMVADGGRRVLLGDFDLAIHLSEGESETTWKCGTMGYLAPEVYQRRAGGRATDVFALGVVLYILLTKSQPFLRDTPLLTELATRDGRLPIEPETLQMFRSHAACDLVLWLLEPGVELRPSASGALESEWFCIRESEAEGLRGLVQKFQAADNVESPMADTSETKPSSPNTRDMYSLVHSSTWLWRRTITSSSPFLLRTSKKQAAEDRGSREPKKRFRTLANSAHSAWCAAQAAVRWKRTTKVKPVDEVEEFDNVFIP